MKRHASWRVIPPPPGKAQVEEFNSDDFFENDFLDAKSNVASEIGQGYDFSRDVTLPRRSITRQALRLLGW